MKKYLQFINEISKNKWEKVNPFEYSDDIISLVQTAYKKSTKGSFINTTRDLAKSEWLAIDIDDYPDLDATIFYRKPRYNETFSNYKIQGLGHDGSIISINVLLNKLKQLLESGDYWVEASGAVEKVLYKMGVKYVDNEEIAQKIFPTKNLKFNGYKGQYNRISDNDILKETIFGTPKFKK